MLSSLRRSYEEPLVAFLVGHNMQCDLMDQKRSLTATLVKTVCYRGTPYGPDKYHDRHGLIVRVIPTGWEL